MPAKSARESYYIYWLAGILDGEGSFGSVPCPIIKVGMTDLDTIERVKFIMGVDNKISVQEDKTCTMYVYRVYGNDAIQWMMTLYSLMCARRKRKISEILSSWKTPGVATHGKTAVGDFCKRGHYIVGSNVHRPGDYIRCKICSTSETRARDRAYKERLLELCVNEWEFIYLPELRRLEQELLNLQAEGTIKELSYAH